MKVLVVGGGGREHAIVQKLKESKEITALYCAPGNGGIARDAVCVPIKATDVEAIADWAAAEKMDYVVVTPDDPLCQSFDNCGLTYTRLTDQHRIILGLPGKNPDHIPDLFVTANDRIQLLLSGTLYQVLPVFI